MTLPPEIQDAVEGLAATWWQPRNGNEHQSFAGRKADLAQELVRFVDLSANRPTRARLFGAAAAIYRNPGRPWGTERGSARVTAETFPSYAEAAQAIEAAVFGPVLEVVRR